MAPSQAEKTIAKLRLTLPPAVGKNKGTYLA